MCFFDNVVMIVNRILILLVKCESGCNINVGIEDCEFG